MKSTLLVLALLMSGCTMQESINVPVKFCNAVLTGQKTSTTTFVCVMTDINNPCGVMMPVETSAEEVEVSCKYREWR